jgi:nitrite reductase/ring-hydroxylating ferredoxin subunit
MLTREENELLTRVGPGTAMGSLIRRYWIPALFADQVTAPDGPPVRVKLLGERLVAFRDSSGRVGLVDERCPHRTASLFFARNEECGLRCVYHGWKFDVDGNCVDMPSEPASSNFKDKVRLNAYPCLERGGVVWTYMGLPALQPAFPELQWTEVPPSHRFATRHIQECNWLQAFEGGFDTSHLSFLHGGTVQGGPVKLPTRYEVVPTDFGFVAGTGREDGPGSTNWTANVMLMPFHKLIATQPIGAHAWVPVDDETTMTYSVEYWPHRPLEDGEMAESRNWLHIHAEPIAGTDHTVRNKANDYLIDRSLQRGGTSYTGIPGLAMQDCGIQESMGPIAERTVEHLGVSDTIIIKLRRFLLATLRDIAAGSDPPGLDPASYRVRSTRFTLPDNVRLADAVGDRVRAGTPAYAK